MRGITVFVILCTAAGVFAEAEQEKISPFDAAVRDYQSGSYELFRNGYTKAFPATAIKLTAKQPTPYEVMTSRSANPFLSEEKVDQPDYRAAGKAVSEFGNAVNSWQGAEGTLPTWTGSPDTGSKFKDLAKTASPNEMLSTSVDSGHDGRGESKSRLEAFQRGVTNSSSAVTSEFNARQKEFDAANKAAKEQAELTERQFAEAQLAQQQALTNQASPGNGGGGGGGGGKSGSGSGSGSGDSASKPLDLSGVNRGLASLKPPEESGFPETAPPSGLGKGGTSSSMPITPVSLSNQALPVANSKATPAAPGEEFSKLTLSGSKETPNQLFFNENANSGPGGFPDNGGGNTPVRNANGVTSTGTGGEPPPLGKTPNDSRQYFQTNRGGGFQNGGSSGGDGGVESSGGGSDESGGSSSSASIAKNNRPPASDEPLPAVNDKSGIGILAYRHNLMKQLCARAEGIKGFDCRKDQHSQPDRQIAMEPPGQAPNFIMLGQSGAL